MSTTAKRALTYRISSSFRSLYAMQSRRQTPKKKRMLARVALRFSAMAGGSGGCVDGGYGL
jgi:hypothetical protein